MNYNLLVMAEIIGFNTVKWLLSMHFTQSVPYLNLKQFHFSILSTRTWINNVIYMIFLFKMRLFTKKYLVHFIYLELYLIKHLM